MASLENNSTNGITEEVFGFALESGLLDKKFLNFQAGLSKRGMQFIDLTHKLYDCNEEIYKRLSIRFRSQVPTNLTILCLSIDPDLLKKGIMPTVIFKECLNEKKGCHPISVRDKMLREFYVWSFSLADESDFALPKTRLDVNYTASLISVSNWYYKRATMILREVDIIIQSGKSSFKLIQNLLFNPFEPILNLF